MKEKANPQKYIPEEIHKIYIFTFLRTFFQFVSSYRIRSKTGKSQRFKNE